METSKKEGYIAGGIFLLIGLIVLISGIGSGWQAGKLTIIVGGFASLLGVGGLIKPDVIGDILNHYLKSQAMNNSSQNMSNSPHSAQQRAGRDSIIKQIDNRTTIYKKEEKSTSREERNKIKEEEALRKIRAKMIRAMKLVNDSANMGVGDTAGYAQVQEAVEEFIETKMEYEIDLDSEIKEKFNQAMGALRQAVSELHSNLRSNKLKESLKGLDSFRFMDKVNEADAWVAKKLRSNY